MLDSPYSAVQVGCMIKRLLVAELVAVLYWVHPFSLPLSAFSRPTCSCIRIEKRNLKLCFHRMCGILILFSIINFGGVLVAICYKKLWKLLIDRDMQKKDLRIAAGLSTNVIAKLGKNQNVSTINEQIPKNAQNHPITAKRSFEQRLPVKHNF